MVKLDKTMNRLIAELAVVQDANPKAKVSLVKLTQGLYVKAKEMQEKGFCTSDMGWIGVYMENIKHHHPQAFEYYDIRVRQLLCQQIDCAQYAEPKKSHHGWGN
jgi:hypothetical protein